MDIDSEKNTVVVGKKDFLFVKKIYLRDINILGDIEDFNENIFIKVRSTGKLIKANVRFKKNATEVSLIENEMGVSPGQACVFYLKNKFGDKVMGGGWISKTINNFLST